MNALQYHLDGATEDDLVLIAIHNGRAHAVVKKDAGFPDLDDDIIFELRAYALRAEIDHRIATANPEGLW